MVPQLLIIALSGLSLASLYFITASGFSLIFGVMKTVNFTHGGLYLLGGYVGYEFAARTGNWYLAILVGGIGAAVVGGLLNVVFLRRVQGQLLRQGLMAFGLAIVLADQMIARWGGQIRQLRGPDWIVETFTIPGVGRFGFDRLSLILGAIVVGVLLWLLLKKTRLGIIIRAGTDDREMLAALGINISAYLIVVFMLGAFLAGMAGVAGGTTYTLAPGIDMRFMLYSLVVVIVGGMGSIAGTAIGAIIIGLTQMFALYFAPQYGILLVFLVMALVLAIRPTGLMGRAEL